MDISNNVRTDKAIFAAGCFWGIEAGFKSINGVISTTVGYTGGSFTNPTYKDVCSGNTGHAEAVLIEYDPNKISYEELLNIFWKIHNPTTLNRQGPDIGSQYRSAIFYTSEEQKIEAVASRKKLEESKVFKNKIITDISIASEFYTAEEYHQNYYEKTGMSKCNI